MSLRAAQRLWVLLLVLLLQACAATRAAAPATPPAAPAGTSATAPVVGQAKVWWQLALRRPYDGSRAPDWASDLLLADRVLGPLVAAQGAKLPLWRFHRRAGVDGAGHQLSLIFYADETTAAALFAAARDDLLVQGLLARGLLTEVWTGCHLGRPCSAEIAATSDPDWHPALAPAWPAFAMGVSASWLALVQTLSAADPAADADLDSLLARYERVRQQMNAIWRGQGQHAYLHHLSAIFGYEPLLILKEIQF